MPRQQHHPFQSSRANGKANYDVDKHFVSNEQGEVVDRRNMRLTSMDGNNFLSAKINGEEVVYPNYDNRPTSKNKTQNLVGNWECIGAIDVKDNIVEFWVDTLKVNDPLIRINGLIACMSPDLPFLPEFPLQMDKNENCVGGEVYVTDFNSTPMLFNVDDMLFNIGEIGGTPTEKYFTEFNLSKQTLILTTPINVPVFKGLKGSVPAGNTTEVGASGLKVGAYLYAFRYVTTDGDRTQWSPNTPLINVIAKANSGNTNYRGHRYYGAEVGTTTNLGVHVDFRIINDGTYERVEVRRVAYDDNNLIDLGESGVVANISISEYNDVDVLTLYDRGGEIEEILDLSDDSATMAVVEKAKSVRYFNNKLYLFNIEYADRDISDSDGETKVELSTSANNNKIFPTVEYIGKLGHNDPVNASYKRDYMGGELYGFGIKFYDSSGERTFIYRNDDLEDVIIPNRRESTNQDTQNTSYKGYVKAAREDGTVGGCHEKFDTLNASSKSNNDQHYLNALNVSDNSYNVLNPTRDGDTSTGDLSINPNPTVKVTGNGDNRTYSPKGFDLDYYSTGMAINGLSKYPDWVSAFSIVRTAPAKRVVAQGIGMYELSNITGKEADKIRFYSPDLDSNISLDPTVFDDIVSNPENYALEFVSPLGFFSEIYNVQDTDEGTIDIDSILYARILKDDDNSPEILVGESNDWGLSGGDGLRYTAFGRWRNNANNIGGIFKDSKNNVNEVDISSISEVVNDRGNRYISLTAGKDIYQQITTGNKWDFTRNETRKWHEPLYVINIVKKNITSLGLADTASYLETGHVQKIDSLIGRSNATNSQEMKIVDERWEDFLQDIRDKDNPSNQAGTYYSNLERYISVEDINGDRKKWIDVTWKDTAAREVILDDITANGFHATSDGTKVYGIYRVFIKDNDSTEFSIIFSNDMNSNGYSNSLFIPVDEAGVYIEYDNRIPVRFFGGDSWVGESVFSAYDEKSNNGATMATPRVQVYAGLPYMGARFPDNWKIIKNSSSSGFLVDAYDGGANNFRLNGISGNALRQILVSFCVQSRVNVNYNYSVNTPTIGVNTGTFPNVHYRQRPWKWNNDSFSSGNLTNIYTVDNEFHPEYGQQYGDEYLEWEYGGFKTGGFTVVDYSRENDFRLDTSKPDYIESQAKFCTRGIWSLPNNINEQDSPNIRTFLPLNIFDFTDDTGEIKYAFDEESSSGGEITVFTDRGIIRALIDKRLLNEVSGGTLSAVAGDSSGILQQIVISRDIGMDDEMWRTAAEYNNILMFANHESVYAYTQGQVKDIGRTGYHTKIYQNMLKNIKPKYGDKLSGAYDSLHEEYWLSINTSVVEENYTLESGWNFVGENAQKFEIVPQNNYLYEFNKTTSYYAQVFLNNDIDVDEFYISSDFSSASSFDITATSVDGFLTTLGTVNAGEIWKIQKYSDYNNYWTAELVKSAEAGGVNEFEREIKHTFVFSTALPNGGAWIGEHDYNFDKYISFRNKMFGVRDLKTYELDKGNQINNANIVGEIHLVSNAEPNKGKEFIRVRINSDNKPTSVKFYDNFENYQNDLPSSTLDTTANPLHLKDYNGFEGYVPRKDSGNRPRQQGRYMIFKVIHNTTDGFEVSTVETQYKTIK